MLKITVQRVKQFPAMKIAEKKAKELSSMKIVAQRAKLVQSHSVLMGLMLALSSCCHHPAYKQISNPGRSALPRISQSAQEIYLS